jgi:divalent metal cation (Fe/Co/Zn/Cd) transporter
VDLLRRRRLLDRPGVLALRGGTAIGDPTMSFGVLAVAFVAEGISLRRAARQLHEGARQSQTTFGRFIRDVRDPAPRIVLLEDAAAVAGILVAAAGLGATVLTGSEVFDALGSIGVGLILAAAAVGVGAHAKALLLGEAAWPEMREFLERQIESHPEVVSVADLRTMHIGPDDVLVAGRVEFQDDLTVPEVEALTERIIDDLRRRDPVIGHVFLQPATAGGGPS